MRRAVVQEASQGRRSATPHAKVFHILASAVANPLLELNPRAQELASYAWRPLALQSNHAVEAFNRSSVTEELSADGAQCDPQVYTAHPIHSTHGQVREEQASDFPGVDLQVIAVDHFIRNA